MSSGSHQRGRLQAAFLHLTQLRLPRGAISPSQSLQVKGQEFPARSFFSPSIIILFCKKVLSACVLFVVLTRRQKRRICRSGAVPQGWGSPGASPAGAAWNLPRPLPSAASGAKPGPAKPSPRPHSGRCFQWCTPRENAAAAGQEQSRSVGRA